MNERPVRVLLDTDIASDVDDALCLAFGLASPEIELVGITTVGRESELRASVASKLVSLAGRPPVPTFAGCRTPVLDGDGFGLGGHEGEGILEPGEEVAAQREHAVDAILRITREQPDVEIVAVGPLTNLAVALMKDPDLPGRVRRLHVMGGHLRKVEYGGHVFAPGVDYNLCSDPHAAFRVLRSGMPTQLVTADVTLETWLPGAVVDALRSRGTKLHDSLARAIELWAEQWRPRWSRQGCDTADHVAFLHDPLTLACAFDDSFCSFETLEIETTIEPGDRLRTFERDAATDASFPMRCATRVDADRFRAFWLERVLSL